MMVVLSLPMLLGVAALVIDLGMMSLAAQRVQHVTDLAALAGATRVEDTAASTAAADETAETNNSFSNWQVDTATTIYGPGDTVPGYRTLGYREYVTDVTGTTDFDFAFARIFGLERATITRRSAAVCEVWRNRLARGFIFAGSTDPSVWGVYSDGLSNQFNGSIHSNTGVSLNGGGNVVTGDILYRNAYEQNGPDFTLDGAVIETPVTLYPVDFAWADFWQNSWDHDVASINATDSGGSLPSGCWHVRGDMNISASDFHCNDSLFVVEGNIVISGARPIFTNVTLVARGSITFSGADGAFSPFMHDVFAFSLMASSSDVMNVEGSRCDASGVLFAPYGGLRFQGSPMNNYQIGLVGNTVTLLGGGMIHDGPASALVADETSDMKLVL